MIATDCLPYFVAQVQSSGDLSYYPPPRMASQVSKYKMRRSLAPTASDPPILVTGSHYSGSTLVGRVLSASHSIRYIHEPFNIENSLSCDSPPFDLWFKYVDRHDDGVCKDYIRSIIENNVDVYSMINRLRQIKKFSDVFRVCYYIKNVFNARVGRARPLFKDPISVFSMPWLMDTFGMQVICTVRHPCAFSESYARRNSRHNFEHFVKQHALMDIMPGCLREIILLLCQQQVPIHIEAAVMWVLIYHFLLKSAEGNDRCFFVKHEEFAPQNSPIIECICYALNIELCNRVKYKAIKLMRSNSSVDYISGTGDTYVTRKSDGVFDKWRNRLSLDIQREVFSITEPVAKMFDYRI